MRANVYFVTPTASAEPGVESLSWTMHGSLASPTVRPRRYESVKVLCTEDFAGAPAQRH
jgi:hypothetical protein